MALEWVDRIDGESEINADDINKLAGAIKDNEKAIEDTAKDLQQSILETNQSIIDVSTNLQKSIDDTNQSLGNDIEEKTIINDATNTSIRLNDSSNNNFRDIDIADTTNSEVTIDVYGKNLYGYKKPRIVEGKIIEELENGVIAQGNQKESSIQANSYSRGWLMSGWSDETGICPTLYENQTVTVSADITLLETGNSPTPNVTNIHLYVEGTGNGYTGKYNISLPINEKKRISQKFTISSAYSGAVFYPAFCLNSNKLKIENIQIEFGETATEYEKYKEKQTVTLPLPLTDEGKEQFKTLHSNKPTTTILNDKNIEMTVVYEADAKSYIDNKFNELNNAILSIGGNI